MRYKFIIVLLSLIALPSLLPAQNDWNSFANFERFATANKALSAPVAGEQRVVLMGNSITEAWPVLSPEFFKDHPNLIGRGISGQTTPQMLLRFRADVVDLKPNVVVILAGTNDLAGNTGDASNESILANIKSMTEIALQNGITVLLSSIIPAIDFPWKPGQKPAERIKVVNVLLKDYAKSQNLEYVDYYKKLVDKVGGLKVPEYTSPDDLVHPNKAGYQVMEKVLMKELKKYLEQ